MTTRASDRSPRAAKQDTPQSSPQLDRRQILARLAAIPCSAAIANAAGAVAGPPGGQPAESDLIALPGKKPLIKRTFRAPNFETPVADLRAAFTANDRFFVRYHLSNIPEVDPVKWRLRLGGNSVRNTVELSMEDLKRKFTHVSVAAINQCAGLRRGLFSPRVPGVQWKNGAIGNALWTGVRLRDVLDHAGVREDAVEAVFDGSDFGVLPATPDFLKSLPIDHARDENTLIAFQMNGQPLPHWNGAPARLVVPGWAATYWVKHLTEIRVEPRAFDGFWMKSAYRVPANAFPITPFASQQAQDTWPVTNLLVNSLVTSHTAGDKLPRGKPALLRGWAWDGGSGIAAVAVSADGHTWREAALGKDLGRFAWRGFELPIDTQTPGPVKLLVRASARDGSRQPDTLTANPAGYYNNVVQALELEVV